MTNEVRLDRVVGPELARALLDAQLAMEPLEKSKTVDTGKFTYSYCPLPAMLAAIRPVFGLHGLAIVFRSWLDQSPMMSCAVIHAKTGQVLEAVLPVSLPEDERRAGSKISYFKRYLLGMVTGIVAEEDDDARMAREPEPEPERPPNRTTRKDLAIDYVQRALGDRFGGEKPWLPIDKCRVLKDLFGSGKWSDFMKLPDAYMAPALKTKSFPVLGGKSRFEATMDLVGVGIRRPEDVSPDDWPQAYFDEMNEAEGGGTPITEEEDSK